MANYKPKHNPKHNYQLPMFPLKLKDTPQCRQEMSQKQKAYYSQYQKQRHAPKLVAYIGGNVNIQDFNALYPQVTLTDPPYSITKRNWDYQDTDSIMLSENEFAKFSKKDQQFVKAMMRRFERYKKHQLIKETWKFSLGEAMRKWLHQLGALHVHINYIEMNNPQLNEISLNASFLFHNQNIQLNIEYEPQLIQKSDGEIFCYRFRLRSIDNAMAYTFQFIDITKMEYYLNVLTQLYSNDKKVSISGMYSILLGETHPEDDTK